MLAELVVFIGTMISLTMVAVAVMPGHKPEQLRNVRRIMVRARGVEIFHNKIGEN